MKFNHEAIENWTETDLLELPESETDDYEYKSSRIQEAPQYRLDLQNKICRAASAFWNTGGGIFIAGVDDSGAIDGGLPRLMGKQKLRDWVDQVLGLVTPTGPYTVRTIKPKSPNSQIQPGNVVLVIAFGESVNLPHMAPDHRYYVRAGAHTNPAGHYLVEAIRARRGLQRPILRGLLRLHPTKSGVIELAIITTNAVTALDVTIDFDNPPALYNGSGHSIFPMQVPIIDQDNPFRMDITTTADTGKWFAGEPVTLRLVYHSLLGEQFDEQQRLDPANSISTRELEALHGSSVEAVLGRIAEELTHLRRFVEARTQEPSDR